MGSATGSATDLRYIYIYIHRTGRIASEVIQSRALRQIRAFPSFFLPVIRDYKFFFSSRFDTARFFRGNTNFGAEMDRAAVM